LDAEGSFPGIKLPVVEGDHSSLRNSVVKIECSRVFIPSCAFWSVNGQFTPM
jgi:hypothetical protein